MATLAVSLPLPRVGVRLFVTTPNVEESAKRAKSAGLTLISEPQDTGWKNTRAFEVADPSGFLLTVISQL